MIILSSYDKCLNSDAVLFGAIGDPKFDNDPSLKIRPEQMKNAEVSYSSCPHFYNFIDFLTNLLKSKIIIPFR